MGDIRAHGIVIEDGGFIRGKSGSVAIRRCQVTLVLVKRLVHGVERGDELDSQNIGLRSRKIFDPQPFVARLEQLMPVEPPAAAQLIRCDPRRELAGGALRSYPLPRRA